jgi:hypothetical protein
VLVDTDIVAARASWRRHNRRKWRRPQDRLVTTLGDSIQDRSIFAMQGGVDFAGVGLGSCVILTPGYEFPARVIHTELERPIFKTTFLAK